MIGHGEMAAAARDDLRGAEHRDHIEPPWLLFPAFIVPILMTHLAIVSRLTARTWPIQAVRA